MQINLTNSHFVPIKSGFYLGCGREVKIMKKLLFLIILAVVFALSVSSAFAAKPKGDPIDEGTFDLPKPFEITVPPSMY